MFYVFYVCFIKFLNLIQLYFNLLYLCAIHIILFRFLNRNIDIKTTFKKYMKLTLKKIKQKILHHKNLTKLKIVDNLNVFESFCAFVDEMINDNNVKNREIFNLMRAKNEKLNVLIIMNDDINYIHCYKKN